MTIVSTARRARLYPLAILAVGVFVLTTPPRCTYAVGLPSTNLIVNPGAESDTGNGGTPKVSPSGWINTTEADVLAYAQFLAPGGPGPATPGNNLFGGGYDSSATLTQTIDVSAAAAGIDVGTAPYTLCGFLGGYASQEDNAVVTASFQTAGATSTGSASIGPVTAADRAFVSGTCLRSTSGIIPAGTRKVVITLTFTNNTPGGPFNDGYADNLNFLYSATCPEAVGIACTPPTTTTSSTTSSTSTSTTTTTATPATSSTTTSSSTTPTSTSTSTSTTTTRAPVTTTTTTLSGACPVGATFDSIDCRLRALLADTSAAADLGSLQQGLVKTLTAARDRFEQLPSATKPRKAKAIIRFTERKLVSYAHRIRSNKGRKTIPEATRTGLTDAAEPIRSDLLALRGQ